MKITVNGLQKLIEKYGDKARWLDVIAAEGLLGKGERNCSPRNVTTKPAGNAA